MTCLFTETQHRYTSARQKTSKESFISVSASLKRVNVDAEKKRKDSRQFGEPVCTKRNMSSSEVMSVPESLLRQSVSTTVWPAAGEKHFRVGK